MEKKEMKDWGETVNGIIDILEKAEQNQEIVLNLVENEVLLLEKNLSIQLKKEYVKMEKLKKIIKKISTNSISMMKISEKNKLEKKLESLMFIVERG